MNDVNAQDPLPEALQTRDMRRSCTRVSWGILGLLGIYGLLWIGGVLPQPHHAAAQDHAPVEDTPHPGPHDPADAHHDHQPNGHAAVALPAAADAQHAPQTSADQRFMPPLVWITPFAVLLLSIALLPLIPRTAGWWHRNRNRFIVAAGLGLITLGFYAFVHEGGLVNHFTHAHGTAPGWETAFAAFCNAILTEFLPFIVLLFSLYVISGGVNLRGDLPAYPMTNVIFLGIGTLLASFIGTTGAAMVLIRPLLTTNAERRYKVHTVVFFIFMVCNCGGLLLPIGDPPLFLGYLKGVSFTWTLGLWPYWLLINGMLLFIYFLWDMVVYRKESPADITRDVTEIRPLQLTGKMNFLYLLGVVLCVAFVVPDKPFLGTHFQPPQFLRECLMLALVALSLKTTNAHTRVLNRFDYIAIVEVAALFCGIFLCMQVPVEILNIKGAQMGINSPIKFFWATGVLSSFLDNAPTYVVFFETARTMAGEAANGVVHLASPPHIIGAHLVAISLGAVFMGANTYIGNGPNFMVKSIAEQAGVRMPSFFGYMLYSGLVLIPLFIIMTLLFRP